MNYNFEILGDEDDFLSPIKVSVQSNNAVKLEGNKLGILSFCRYLAEDETTFGVDEIIVGHPWCDSMITKDSLNLYLYQAEMVYVPQRQGKTFAQYGYKVPPEMDSNEYLLEPQTILSLGQNPSKSVDISYNKAGCRTLCNFLMLVATEIVDSVTLHPRSIVDGQGELDECSLDLIISRVK